MPTTHGKNAALYMGAATGTAVPLAETNEISFSFAPDFAEDSAHGDTNKSYVPGLFDFEGTIAGHYDTNDNTLLAAALASTKQKFYFYPNRSWSFQYFYGQAFVALNDLTAPLNAVVGNSFTLRAAGTVTQVFTATTG